MKYVSPEYQKAIQLHRTQGIRNQMHAKISWRRGVHGFPGGILFRSLGNPNRREQYNRKLCLLGAELLAAHRKTEVSK